MSVLGVGGSVVGSRFYSIKNHGIFLSEKRALFLMDTWFYLFLKWSGNTLGRIYLIFVL